MRTPQNPIPPQLSTLTIRDRIFQWGDRTYLMGILNVTPDSFSDGGQFDTVDAALQQARQMVEAGADIIDVGGQSTRPGAVEISLAEELDRVIPTIDGIRQSMDSIVISVDTSRSEVARAAVEAGADIVNDITGGRGDSQMLPTIAGLGVPAILMHMRGTPQTMQTLTDYKDLMGEICQVLQHQANAAIEAGIGRSNIILDPGIGFAKTYEQNLIVLRNLSQLRALEYPLLVGVSRKSFIGRILNRDDPKARVWGTGAACTAAIAQATDILRVHDVGQMYDICRVADAIFRD
ncbi:dihydropteroate synthase [Oscillatoriales cyanobacterium LEGE 11467]|uniref:Dihydropteroate synthase n=1 Tax=Zarconia navalis LEGE 11467 TaxID=1828826 RepID=A0A928VW01_9CYAN|nr:dihydropteroate synthase [Zarconia navalis]MBE9041262.1 dihydropteroate synthase [Zarconia navalis LEGE 11467]